MRTILIILIIVVCGCSPAPKIETTQQVQTELTAEQQVKKQQYIEKLREIFYGDDFGMFRAVEITHLRQESAKNHK